MSTILKIVELVKEHFDLRPGAIIRDLNLRRPIYRKTAAYGHFGRTDIVAPWKPGCSPHKSGYNRNCLYGSALMQKIDRYEIERAIPGGGMADVYLARDPNTERQVVVKVIKREYGDNEEFRVRFRREARTITTLNRFA